MEFQKINYYYSILNISAISNIVSTKLHIYPNPANDYLFIDGFNTGKVVIYDYKGKIVYENNYSKPQLNISNLSNGIYIIKIENNKDIVSFKFIKQ